MAPAVWKKKVVHEVIEYWINFGYLAFFLVAFIWYRLLVLAEYQVQYTDYWFPLIEAAVLAKVIMIGDYLRLGRGLEQKPLILPALYRTVMFSVWVGIFSVLEETVRGLVHGKGLASGVEEIASRGWYELLSRCVVILWPSFPSSRSRNWNGCSARNNSERFSGGEEPQLPAPTYGIRRGEHNGA